MFAVHLGNFCKHLIVFFLQNFLQNYSGSQFQNLTYVYSEIP